MAWLLLLVAALLEVGWAIGLKYTHGFTRLWPSAWTVLSMIASMALLAQAARTLPIGTLYAVWTGIGAAGPPFWACTSSPSRSRPREWPASVS